jgi:hypothetical protein
MRPIATATAPGRGARHYDGVAIPVEVDELEPSGRVRVRLHGRPPSGSSRPPPVFSFEGPIRIARSTRGAITGIRSIARAGGRAIGNSKRRAGSKIMRKRCRDFGVAKIGISGAVFVTAGKCPLPPISALRDVCACNPLISLDGGAPAIGVTGSNSTQRGSNPLSPASHRGLFIGPALREVSTFPAVRAREPGLLRRKSGTPHRRPRFSGRVSAR